MSGNVTHSDTANFKNVCFIPVVWKIACYLCLSSRRWSWFQSSEDVYFKCVIVQVCGFVDVFFYFVAVPSCVVSLSTSSLCLFSRPFCSSPVWHQFISVYFSLFSLCWFVCVSHLCAPCVPRVSVVCWVFHWLISVSLSLILWTFLCLPYRKVSKPFRIHGLEFF